MKEYVRSIRHAFGRSEDIARFIGVAVVTVDSWCTGRREPTGENYRMLQVLGVLMLEAPDLFATLAGVREKPKRAALPVLPEAPPIAPRVARKGPEWPDGYWYPRTVTREQWENGEYPLIEDGADVLNKLSAADEERYWASLKAYEVKTGRIKPE